MKRIILALAIVLFWLSPAVAEEYVSPFGFSVDIPPHWIILSKQEVKENPDLFDFENKTLGNIDQEFLQRIKKMIRSGRMEFYFNQETSDAKINVTKTVARLPKTASELENACKQLGSVLSSQLGRKIRVYECKFKQTGGLKGFYAEFDGAAVGTRSMQYQVQKSPSVVLVITATCGNENLLRIRSEFEHIMNSFQLTTR